MMRKDNRLSLIFPLLVLVFLMGSTAYGQKDPATAQSIDPAEVKAVTPWLSSHAIRLKSVEAGNGFEDLQPLKKILKDIRIVGLGEATHGSREFFQFKHRMVEFLVKEMGYRVFLLEASYSACMNINDYVLFGKGGRNKALASQGFWTWNTEEVSDMIEWMREYNKTAPEGQKVKFYGYDLQVYEQAVEVVLNYLKKVAPAYVEKAEAAFKPLDRQTMRTAPLAQRSKEDKAKIAAGLNELMGFLAFNKTPFVRETSLSEFEFVLQHARMLTQYLDSYSRPMNDPQEASKSAGGSRDYYMAENIDYLANQEGSKTRMIVWAHNGHIQLTSYAGGIPSTGYFLRKWFGDAYYALGFTLYEGGLQAMEMVGNTFKPLTDFSLPPAPEGSVGWCFHEAGIQDALLDFRSAPKEGVIANWLKSPHGMQSIGSAFGKDWTQDHYMVPTVLKDTFDGIIYIERTTRARPNAKAASVPAKTPEAKNE
jgi:erythromycin esterase